MKTTEIIILVFCCTAGSLVGCFLAMWSILRSLERRTSDEIKCETEHLDKSTTEAMDAIAMIEYNVSRYIFLTPQNRWHCENVFFEKYGVKFKRDEYND